MQKHDATLHYDFRLELDGAESGGHARAIDRSGRQTPAVRVEDHLLNMAASKERSAKAKGGGTADALDKGTWSRSTIRTGVEAGDLKFRLNGKRMKGEWVLVYMKRRDRRQAAVAANQAPRRFHTPATTTDR